MQTTRSELRRLATDHVAKRARVDAYIAGDAAVLASHAAVFSIADIKQQWPTIEENDEQADVIAAFLACAKQPYRFRDFLRPRLIVLHSSGKFLFDGETAQRAHAEKDDSFTVYRGACANECDSAQYALSWTEDKSVAEKFAKQGGYRAGVLSMTINAEDAYGWIFERGEKEIVLPLQTGDPRVTVMRRVNTTHGVKERSPS